MRCRCLAAVVLLVVVLLCGWPAPAAAGELSILYSTLFRAHDYFDVTGERVRSRALSPAVVLSATELLGQDLAFAVNARGVREFEGFHGPEDDRSDLLYATLTWRDRGGRTTVAFGRQLAAQGPGYVVFDGIRAAHRIGLAELSAAVGFGFERDGARRTGGRYEQAGVRLHAGRVGSLAATIERGTDAGLRVLLKESLDVVAQPLDALTLRGSYIWNGAVGELDEALATADLRLGQATVSAEAGRIHPHFDPSTIWNVFNSGPYDRAALRIRHAIGERSEIRGRYERRQYWSERGNNRGRSEPVNSSNNDALSVGFASVGRPLVRYDVEFFWYDGFGGYRAGGALRLGHDLSFVPARVEGGIDLRAYNRGVRDSHQDRTTAYWAQARLELGRHAGLSIKLEDYRNGFVTNDFRVTVKLDVTSAEWFR